jgi:hypothetical protein
MQNNIESITMGNIENCVEARDIIIREIGYGDIEESLAKIINLVEDLFLEHNKK